MWGLILNFLGGPFINGMLSAYGKYLQSRNTTEDIAAQLAARELAVQSQEIQSITQYRIAELGRWYEPDKIMGYCVAILFGKIIIYDTIFGLGVTNLHQGWMTTTANLIVVSYFGKRGAENVAKIIQGIRGK
jgi:hypothetical protein